jgi:HlyD family secretion protein
MKRAMIAGALFLAACGDAPSDVLQGYGEAEYIYLASQETGVIGELFVREGDVIEAGAPVFSLDTARLEYSAESASARRAASASAVATAAAEAELARRNYARSVELSERGFYPRARLDADRAARDAANARLTQARRESGAAGAETNLARERLGDLAGAAPVAGVIDRIYHRPGEVVAAGAPIAALLAPENMKVRFFAPEAMLTRLAVGQIVQVSCDGCAEDLTARITYASSEPEFTPPVIYSLDQRGKLVFLIEARPEQVGAIRPGMPVDVRLTAP